MSWDEDCEVTMSGKPGQTKETDAESWFSLILNSEEDSAPPRKAENRVLGMDIESPLPAPQSRRHRKLLLNRASSRDVCEEMLS